jgi:hypothetical protein
VFGRRDVRRLDAGIPASWITWSEGTTPA